MKTILYAKDKTGNLRVWYIEGLVESDKAEIRMSHGVYGGEMNYDSEFIDEGLAGRTIEEQMHSRINSRINSKVNAGYVRSLDEAREGKRVNPLGYERPMLAAVYKKIVAQIDFLSGIYIQRKYNGHRCLVKNDCGALIAYSRNGKEIKNIQHILDEIDIPEGTILDGELYHHGTKFQTISSWIKKNQPETKKIKYVIYDVVMDEDYKQRLFTLKSMPWLKAASNSQLALTTMIYSQDLVNSKLNEFISDGYEGAILRVAEGVGYQDSRRSKGLIKVKKFLDDEFLVVDVVSSSEGWGILSCVSKNGKKFGVSAPGTVFQKTEILKNKGEYIGRFAHIEFSEYTASKIPFHPVCIGFRDKLAE